MNPTEVNMIFDIMQVCPKKGLIRDIWGKNIAFDIVENDNQVPRKGDPNPVNMLEQDWQSYLKRINQSYLPATDGSHALFPKSILYEVDHHKRRWEDTKSFSWARNFNDCYKIQSHKNVLVKPGGRIDFDVVIPGFGYNFNKYCDVLKSSQGQEWIMKEIYSTFTRFLLVRFKSVMIHKDISNAQDENLGNIRIGEQCRVAVKLSVSASKYFKSRMLPVYHHQKKFETEGDGDFDWKGRMKKDNGVKVIDYFDAIKINKENQASDVGSKRNNSFRGTDEEDPASKRVVVSSVQTNFQDAVDAEA